MVGLPEVVPEKMWAWAAKSTSANATGLFLPRPARPDSATTKFCRNFSEKKGPGKKNPVALKEVDFGAKKGPEKCPNFAQNFAKNLALVRKVGPGNVARIWVAGGGWSLQ